MGAPAVQTESIAASRDGLIVQLTAPARADVSAWADAVGAHDSGVGAGGRWTIDQPVLSALSAQTSAPASLHAPAVRASFRLTRRVPATAPGARTPDAPGQIAAPERAP